ncbi:MAG: ATP-binding cassette domain-containing protein [Gammaproteobacteria bacterium]|nr:ATP-binding cassette domain-containing protein [Gammaproteobacteria bacterium]
MRELLQRLALHPWITLELLFASLAASLLALAAPIYVIQILNRYLTYGVDATLVTLTSGVIIAILLEYLFRRLRLLLAEQVGHQRNQQLMLGSVGILSSAKSSALATTTASERQELLSALEIIESTYAAPNLATLLDLPFALLFIAALLLLSPPLGSVALLFITIIFLYALISQRLLRRHLQKLQEDNHTARTLFQQAESKNETIRLFDRNHTTLGRWQQHLPHWIGQRQQVARRQGLLQSMSAALQAVMGVVIYTVGARMVISGDLNIGMLIGANILASRALMPVNRFAQLGEGLAKAAEALQRLQRFATLKSEAASGSRPNNCHAAITFSDVTFSYPGTVQPLFEGVNMTLPAGSVLLVTGSNGCGKTTLSRLLAGILEPVRGKILVDGIDIRQLDPQWWRSQLTYLPQTPELLAGSLKENLLAANSQLEQPQIQTLLRQSGLESWVNQSSHGLDTDLAAGAHLSYGYRRRVTLARALAVGGPLILFDEPTEGIDAAGVKIIYALLIELSRQGKTLILCSDDPLLRQGARYILNLDQKPIPQLIDNGSH